MSDDIVAELDRWLTHVGNPETTNDARFPIAAVQRARDEIMALRQRCAASDVDALFEMGRAEAFEEAIKAVSGLAYKDPFNGHTAGILACIAAIRALKDK